MTVNWQGCHSRVLECQNVEAASINHYRPLLQRKCSFSKHISLPLTSCTCLGPLGPSVRVLQRTSRASRLDALDDQKVFAKSLQDTSKATVLLTAQVAQVGGWWLPAKPQGKAGLKGRQGNPSRGKAFKAVDQWKTGLTWA